MKTNLISLSLTVLFLCFVMSNKAVAVQDSEQIASTPPPVPTVRYEGQSYVVRFSNVLEVERTVEIERLLVSGLPDSLLHAANSLINGKDRIYVEIGTGIYIIAPLDTLRYLHREDDGFFLVTFEDGAQFRGQLNHVLDVVNEDIQYNFDSLLELSMVSVPDTSLIPMPATSALETDQNTSELEWELQLVSMPLEPVFIGVRPRFYWARREARYSMVGTYQGERVVEGNENGFDFLYSEQNILVNLIDFDEFWFLEVDRYDDPQVRITTQSGREVVGTVNLESYEWHLAMPIAGSNRVIAISRRVPAILRKSP